LTAPPREIKPAKFAKRITATIIDSLLLLAIWTIAAYSTGTNLVTSVTVNQASSPATTLAVYMGVLALLYYSLMEGVFSATLGKFALRIRVTTLEGDPCSFSAAFVRNLMRFIDWLPMLYILGTVSVLMSAKRQRLGDRLAKTVVSPAPEKDINPPPAPFLFH